MSRKAGVAPDPTGHRIGPSELALFRRKAAEEAGLAIGEEKSDFLIARLGGEVARLGLPDLASYARHLDRSRDPCVLGAFVEALTTHTTGFFRERAQYDWLAEEGFERLAASGSGRSRPLVIWSAACSSGQELYSAMMLADERRAAGRLHEVHGIGTDISRPVLRRGRIGLYGGDEIEGIPLELRHRYLLSAREGPERFRIVPELRARCRWARANLTRPGELAAIRADLVFLRNVLIYFDGPTRDRVLRAVVARLPPGGLLLTGHSETVDARHFGLRALRPSIYRKEEG